MIGHDRPLFMHSQVSYDTWYVADTRVSRSTGPGDQSVHIVFLWEDHAITLLEEVTKIDPHFEKNTQGPASCFLVCHSKGVRYSYLQ